VAVGAQQNALFQFLLEVLESRGPFSTYAKLLFTPIYVMKLQGSKALGVSAQRAFSAFVFDTIGF
jgi:hypothetical protein